MSVPWKDLGPYAIALVAFLSLLVTYVSTRWWNLYRYLADRHVEILRQGISNPELMDPHRTRRYNDVWPMTNDRRHAYEAYARLCWSHARDIYVARILLVFFRQAFRRYYANTLETYRRLHGIWLENNRSFFPDRRFLRFIEKCQWREYFDARTADRLRWNNEVDDYDQKIIHPLLVVENNPLTEFINGIPQDAKLIIADVGCGNGSFVAKLSADPRFTRVYGVDYSDNMVEMARKKVRGSPNVEIVKIDITELSAFYGKLDLIFSLNSIVPRDRRDTERILREIARSLKPDGRFVAVLPSFDTVEYLRALEFCRFKKLRGEQALGIWRTWGVRPVYAWLGAWLDTLKLFCVERRMSKRKRLYADDGYNIQRFIHERDIEPLLGKYGLTLQQRPQKLHYPWELANRFKYGYFPGKEEIWDWFVVAWKDRGPK